MTEMPINARRTEGADPQWIPAPCFECGRKADTLARLGGEQDGVDLCAGCLDSALRMLGGPPAPQGNRDQAAAPTVEAGSKLARQLAADVLAEELLDLVDGAEPADAGSMTFAEHLERTRLQVETRMWLCAQLHPERYSARAGTGGDELDELLAALGEGE